MLSLESNIFDARIDFSSLWTFFCPIGYNGKIQLWPMKSKKENAVTFFYICLVVITWGIHQSDMEHLSPTVFKLYAYAGLNPLISIVNV